MGLKSIEFEFSQIETELEILSILKRILDQQGLDDIQLRAAASSLHSIYNGIEKILILKLKAKNININTTHRWHIELLEIANQKMIITDRQYLELKEYMGFRHFFRHNYGFMLDSELIAPLIKNIENIVNSLKQ